jgi:hypothetical protein
MCCVEVIYSHWNFEYRPTQVNITIPISLKSAPVDFVHVCSIQSLTITLLSKIQKFCSWTKFTLNLKALIAEVFFSARNEILSAKIVLKKE